MKNIMRCVMCVFIIVSISGCSYQLALTPESRAKIHTVSVEPVVTRPDAFVYDGGTVAGNAAAGSFGLVGLLVKRVAEAPDYDAISNAMTKGNINLNAMLYESFKKALVNQTDFKITQSSVKDAEFKVDICEYGILNRPLNQYGALPFIKVTGSLTNKEGKIFWQLTQTVTFEAPDNVHYKLEDFTQNPDLLAKAFRQIVNQAVDNLVSNLNN